MKRFAVMSVCLAVVLSGCSLAPGYQRPAAAIPEAWPRGAAFPAGTSAAAGVAWRDLVADETLRGLIARALADNRDLRAALANAAAARAQYRVARAAQLPALAATADAVVSRGGGAAAQPDTYDLDVGLSGFELDLFGRLKNQGRQALEAYLGTQSGVQALRLTIVAETAQAYAALAADQDLRRISLDALASRQRALDLTQSLFQAGLAKRVDVEAAITLVEQARYDIATYDKRVAQDRDALELLVGTPLADAELPASLSALDAAVAEVPAGLSSDVLLERPDVVEAEHQLKGAYAGIGAARAAFFPQITLTAAAGVASPALSTLFSRESSLTSVSPAASLPLLGGAAQGNLDYAKAQRDLAVATYDKTIQSAFRDVADALATRGTIRRQRDADQRLVDAADRTATLAEAEHKAGSGSYLNTLTAQQALLSARQNQVAAALADIDSRVALYAAIGADPSLR